MLRWATNDVNPRRVAMAMAVLPILSLESGSMPAEMSSSMMGATSMRCGAHWLGDDAKWWSSVLPSSEWTAARSQPASRSSRSSTCAV
eukprot:6212189-Pleurochrysis_carterae.AAC.8